MEGAGGISPQSGQETKMENLLKEVEMKDIILRGMTDKIEELLRNAEYEKNNGNLKAWAGYLSSAARWAEKYRQAVIEMR